QAQHRIAGNKPSSNRECERNATFVPVPPDRTPGPEPGVATAPHTRVGKCELSVDAGCASGGSQDVWMSLQHPQKPLRTSFPVVLEVRAVTPRDLDQRAIHECDRAALCRAQD